MRAEGGGGGGIGKVGVGSSVGEECLDGGGRRRRIGWGLDRLSTMSAINEYAHWSSPGTKLTGLDWDRFRRNMVMIGAGADGNRCSSDQAPSPVTDRRPDQVPSRLGETAVLDHLIRCRRSRRRVAVLDHHQISRPVSDGKKPMPRNSGYTPMNDPIQTGLASY